MQEASDGPGRLRFGVFEFDLRAGELTKDGRRIRLQGQPIQLLGMLVQKPGELVTREEVHSRLWPGIIVDFDHGVNKAISKIREALGDSAQHPRFVETVARRGYRFLADVAVIEASPEQIRSLAVLPLESLSSDASQDYFADGMTDELITRLGKIGALRVISRTSAMTYKHARRPLPQIARELNVDAVLEGTVLRSGERVRITAQLIQVPNERHIWAESYEGDLQDAIPFQSRVAGAIAEQIRVTLNRREQAALVKSKVVKPAAYEAYLKGRYFWNKRTGDGLKKAIEYFSRAIETDPTYAEAYSGLADSYALSGDWAYGVLSPQDAFAKARTAATQALALDDSLGEAHTSLAFALDLYRWDWEAADREYKLAIKLHPGYATAHLWYAWHLMVMGRPGDGIFELRKAESLDPLSLIISADMADALCIAHLYDESVQQSKKTLEMDPSFAVAHYQLGQALAQKHVYDGAIAAFRRAIELSGHSGAFDSNLAYVYVLSGRTEEAMKLVKNLEAGHDQNPSAHANVALIYVGLGDQDRAMIWLNKAYEERFNPSILLRPAFDNLRSDERFQELVRRIGLPHLAQCVGKSAL
jgi:TolB-like protein/Tfp pilus assembly protein PilF